MAFVLKVDAADLDQDPLEVIVEFVRLALAKLPAAQGDADRHGYFLVVEASAVRRPACAAEGARLLEDFEQVSAAFGVFWVEEVC